MVIDVDYGTKLHSVRVQARDPDNGCSNDPIKRDPESGNGDNIGRRSRERISSAQSLNASSAGDIGKDYDAATTFDAGVGCKRKDREEKGGKNEESERTYSVGSKFCQRRKKRNGARDSARTSKTMRSRRRSKTMQQ